MSSKKKTTAKKKAPPVAAATACSDSYVPFGPEWENEVMKAPKTFIVGMLRKALVANQAAADAVPTNWCDSLLTGPNAELSDKPGSWGCPDIERLLRAVKRRIESSQNDKSTNGGPAND